MRNLNQHRWLPLIAVASILASAPVFFAQAATSGTPATAPAADRIINVTYESPTPEEIGDSLMTYQRYQEAIASYKRAAGSAAVMNKMGIAYQLMFNFQDALRCYDASLKLDPASAHVYNNLGTVYDGLLDYRSAERMYRKALKQEPGSALVVKNLGSNLLAQHKYKQGWEYYKAALALDPKIFEETTNRFRVVNPASIEDRGAVNYYTAKGYLRAGMTDRAIEYLRKSLDEGFTSPKKIMADDDFAGLLGLPAFARLLAEQRNP